MVKMTDTATRHEWVWDRNKFIDRKCIMAEMYDKYEDGLEWQLPQVMKTFFDKLSQKCYIDAKEV